MSPLAPEWMWVTGYGPFNASPQSNPSWDAVQLLPPFLNAHLRVYTSCLRVDYIFVLSVYSQLQRRWQLQQSPFHPPLHLDEDPVVMELVQQLPAYPPIAILHVGVSMQSTCIYVEQRAYNETKGADMQGYTPEFVLDKSPFQLETGLDLQRLCASLRNQSGRMQLDISEDAGRYLCNYVYYLALLLLPKQSLFIHVPPPHVVPVDQVSHCLQWALEGILEQLRLENK